MRFFFINEVEEKEQRLKIAIGIRDLDLKHSDYLHGIAHVFADQESCSIASFIAKADSRSENIVFISKRGQNLKGEIRREVIGLYNSVYGEGWLG